MHHPGHTDSPASTAPPYQPEADNLRVPDDRTNIHGIATGAPTPGQPLEDSDLSTRSPSKKPSDGREDRTKALLFKLSLLIALLATCVAVTSRRSCTARCGEYCDKMIRDGNGVPNEWDRVASAYKEERLELLRALERAREQFTKETMEMSQTRHRERVLWRKEMEEMDQARQRERETWEKERVARDTQKRNLKRADHIRFATPSPHEKCVRYGTREYSAKLLNVPDSMDPVQACAETSVEIHGTKLDAPSFCAKDGEWVFGHWIVSFGEAACSPHWSTFRDKGCTNPGSGIRMYHSHLKGLLPVDDWRTMCSSTPAKFLHHHFDSPTHCANRALLGIWGMFEVPDSSC